MRDLVFVVVSSLFVFASSQDLPSRKFEYKFSFKGPYLSQKDGTVPFWHYSGNAIASDENVRITPSLRSQKGQMWTKQKTDFDWWEVELIFRITGRGRVGADGLAFWFTESRGREGPVFGSSDEWKGLGLFFDSFDNDNKHNNPYIMAVVNDGTKQFDHQTDGSAQQLAGCLRDFRNKPYPVRAKIEYYRNVLTVLINNGVTNNPNDYEMCFRAENVFLPPSGHFGVSAATGGLADDHDVLKLLTYSLRPVLDGTGGGGVGQQPVGRVSEAEKEKLTQEYQNFQQKLDTQRKEYHEKHPEAKKEEHGDYEWFEEEQTKELRQIFQGQSSMFEVLRDLHRKVDELIGRSERTMSLLAQQQQMQGGVMPVQGGVPPPPPPPSGGQGGMMRHEVDQLMAATRELVQMGRDIKAYTLEIHQKSNQIIGNQAKQPVGQGSVQPVGGGYDVHAMVNEVKEGINALRREVTGTNPNQKAGSCDFSQVKCVSVTVLVVFLVSQVAVIVGYLAWKDSRESNMKKFY